MSTVPQNTQHTSAVEISAGLTPAGEADIDSALRHFEATADALGATRPASEELAKLTNQVVDFTRELFPGKLHIETDVDPEMRDDVCLLFQVAAAGTVEEIVALNNMWARRVVSFAPSWPGLFCLFIEARS